MNDEVENKDDVEKNLDVVKAEIKEWKTQMLIGLSRFKHVKFSFGSEGPLHLAQNLVVETIRALPRTLGYVTTTVVLVAAVAVVANNLGG